MNLEELKTEWKMVSIKLESTRQLNEQLLDSIIRERSRSRIASIRRGNLALLFFLLLDLVFLAGILLGNPFDFTYSIQFVPYALLAIGVLMAMGSLVVSLMHFNVNLNHAPLENFLVTTLAAYEKKSS